MLAEVLENAGDDYSKDDMMAFLEDMTSSMKDQNEQNNIAAAQDFDESVSQLASVLNWINPIVQAGSEGTNEITEQLKNELMGKLYGAYSQGGQDAVDQALIDVTNNLASRYNLALDQKQIIANQVETIFKNQLKGSGSQDNIVDRETWGNLKDGYLKTMMGLDDDALDRNISSGIDRQVMAMISRDHSYWNPDAKLVKPKEIVTYVNGYKVIDTGYGPGYVVPQDWKAKRLVNKINNRYDEDSVYHINPYRGGTETYYDSRSNAMKNMSNLFSTAMNFATFGIPFLIDTITGDSSLTGLNGNGYQGQLTGVERMMSGVRFVLQASATSGLVLAPGYYQEGLKALKPIWDTASKVGYQIFEKGWKAGLFLTTYEVGNKMSQNQSTGINIMNDVLPTALTGFTLNTLSAGGGTVLNVYSKLTYAMGWNAFVGGIGSVLKQSVFTGNINWSETGKEMLIKGLVGGPLKMWTKNMWNTLPENTWQRDMVEYNLRMYRKAFIDQTIKLF